MWVNLASMQVVFLDPLCYRYCLDDDEKLVSDITSSELPIDFPLPCTCQNLQKKLYAYAESNLLAATNTANVLRLFEKIPEQ